MDQIQFNGDFRLMLGCTYCGSGSATDDHVPSKILLDKPLVENLPVVPSCYPCNNNLSKDEEYFACLIECAIHGTTEIGSLTREKVKVSMQHSKGLHARIDESKEIIEGRVHFRYDKARFENVILKLARGHIRFEMGELFISEPSSLWFGSLHSLSEAQKDQFFNVDSSQLLPEIGSRAFTRTINVAIPFNPGWITVQEDIYEYYVHWEGEVRVRILIQNYLACEVVWQDQ